MRLILGSDLHGYLPVSIPSGDLMILAGDILPTNEVHDFVFRKLNPWLQNVPVKNIVLTWGNHDWAAFEDLISVHYAIVLIEQTVTISGLKIYGSPWSLPFRKWAWMAPESTLEKIYRDIPDDVDIIVSHAPPYGICDKAIDGRLCGSRSLLKRMKTLSKLKLIVCGHIHEARGTGCVVANVSSVYNFESWYVPISDPWTVVDI